MENPITPFIILIVPIIWGLIFYYILRKKINLSQGVVMTIIFFSLSILTGYLTRNFFWDFVRNGFYYNMSIVIISPLVYGLLIYFSLNYFSNYNWTKIKTKENDILRSETSNREIPKEKANIEWKVILIAATIQAIATIIAALISK